MIRRALKARNKFVPKLRGVTRFSTYLLASFFFFLSKWIERNFGAPNLEQILYHIQFGTEGLLDADQALIHSFIKRCVLLPIVFSIFAVMTERFVGCVRLYGLKGAISLLIRFVVKHVNRAFTLTRRRGRLRLEETISYFPLAGCHRRVSRFSTERRTESL